MIQLELSSGITPGRVDYYRRCGYEQKQMYEFQITMSPVKSLDRELVKVIEKEYGDVAIVVMLHNSGYGTPLIYCTIEHFLADWKVLRIESEYKVVPQSSDGS